jgi:hypothetical protein
MIENSLYFSAKVVMRICYKQEWNAHMDGMLNVNLEKFGEAQAILIFPG